MKTKRQEFIKIVSTNENMKWENNKDFSSMKISFRVSKNSSSYYRAGDYGKKRIHFFSNDKENDKNHYELYHFHIQPRTTHSNKLTCFIKENERIIYTGRNVR